MDRLYMLVCISLKLLLRTMMKLKKKVQLCAICGIKPATTREHIPPSGIFLPPKPNDLVTVPCCFECNNGSSQMNERFQVFLSLITGDDSDTGKRLYHTKVEPTLEHNKRLRRTIIDGIIEMDVRTPSGIYVGETHAVFWDSESHNRVIERILRGLYYHHSSGKIIGSKAKVKVQYLKAISPEIDEKFAKFPLYSIGGDQFLYKFIFCPTKPLYSFWLFQFHGKKWSSGFTVPIKE